MLSHCLFMHRLFFFLLFSLHNYHATLQVACYFIWPLVESLRCRQEGTIILLPKAVINFRLEVSAIIARNIRILLRHSVMRLQRQASAHLTSAFHTFLYISSVFHICSFPPVVPSDAFHIQSDLSSLLYKCMK